MGKIEYLILEKIVYRFLKVKYYYLNWKFNRAKRQFTAVLDNMIVVSMMVSKWTSK